MDITHAVIFHRGAKGSGYYAYRAVIHTQQTQKANLKFISHHARIYTCLVLYVLCLCLMSLSYVICY